jgi:hypothetical protein
LSAQTRSRARALLKLLPCQDRATPPLYDLTALQAVFLFATANRPLRARSGCETLRVPQGDVAMQIEDAGRSVLSAAASALMDKLLDTRGATLFAFAQVEWFLAKIILEAKAFEQYKSLDLSFTQDAEKRADRVKELLNVQGPFSPYADNLRKTIDEVLKSVDMRNFAAHGLFVRADPDDFSMSAPMHLRMFRMYKGGELVDGKLDLTMKEYTDRQVALTAAARDFITLVRKIWIELKLIQLDPE